MRTFPSIHESFDFLLLSCSDRPSDVEVLRVIHLAQDKYEDSRLGPAAAKTGDESYQPPSPLLIPSRSSFRFNCNFNSPGLIPVPHPSGRLSFFYPLFPRVSSAYPFGSSESDFTRAR